MTLHVALGEECIIEVSDCGTYAVRTQGLAKRFGPVGTTESCQARKKSGYLLPDTGTL
jgi:hypothetical protein